MPSNIRSRFLIAYDITDDTKRTKLSHMLQDYGDRVQKSVFEAELTSKDIHAIMRKATSYVGPQDSLRVYPLCANCKNGLQTLGCPKPHPDTTLYIV